MSIRLNIVPGSYGLEGNIYPFCLGKIVIEGSDKFEELFYISLDYWKMEDYMYQWNNGIEKMKYSSSSCLVASIQNSQFSIPLVNWWLLYKEGNSIIIRNQLIAGHDFGYKIGQNIFSPDNCYNFIDARTLVPDNEPQPSEWIVHVDKMHYST